MRVIDLNLTGHSRKIAINRGESLAFVKIQLIGKKEPDEITIVERSKFYDLGRLPDINHYAPTYQSGKESIGINLDLSPHCYELEIPATPALATIYLITTTDEMGYQPSPQSIAESVAIGTAAGIANADPILSTIVGNAISQGMATSSSRETANTVLEPLVHVVTAWQASNGAWSDKEIVPANEKGTNRSIKIINTGNISVFLSIGEDKTTYSHWDTVPFIIEIGKGGLYEVEPADVNLRWNATTKTNAPPGEITVYTAQYL
jgi:hypothetical protein